MKKIVSLLLALSLALTCLVVSCFVVHADDAIETTGTYLAAFSFDNIEEGLELGGLDDEGVDGENKYVTPGSTVGIYYDLIATSDGAFYGNAMKFTSVNGGEGVYAPLTLNLAQTDPKRMDFEGATDFVCYISTKDFGNQRGMRPVMTVNGLDVAGELTGSTNTYFPADDMPAYIQNENKEWVQLEKVESGTLILPENYEGFVRVPIENFKQVDWDGEDVNGKFDLKEVISIAIEVGCYAINDTHSLIVDEVGFLGDFEDGIDPSFLKTGVVVGKETEESKPSEDTSDDQKKEEEKNKDGKVAINPIIWLLIAAGVVVIAAVVIIVVVLSGSKKKNSEEKSEEKEEAPAEEKAE